MKHEYQQFDIIDFAHQVIALHRENESLRAEVEHYKKLHEMNCDSLSEVDKHQKEFIGTMFSALIDPDSVINKGHAALLKEDLNLGS